MKRKVNTGKKTTFIKKSESCCTKAFFVLIGKNFYSPLKHLMYLLIQ